MDITSSVFPTLQTIEDVWPRVSHRPEIRREDKPNGTTVLCYMIANQDTFSSSYERECRGITFRADGSIAGRPLHKFFNVGERPETMPSAIDWSAVTRVMDKRDGSLVHTVGMGDSFDVKSKKSFESHIAVAARQYIAERPGYHTLCTACTMGGWTAIFEWTSPNARIVIDYGREPELQLLHIRNNIDGGYFTFDEMRDISDTFDVPLVQAYTLSGDPMEAARTAQGMEGWVFQFASGDMVKLKTQWYLDRHHTFTALRRRDVARAVVAESLDDLKSKLSLGGVDIAPILQLESEVVASMNAIRADVDELFRASSGMERKDIAIKHKKHPILLAAHAGCVWPRPRRAHVLRPLRARRHVRPGPRDARRVSSSTRAAARGQR